MRAIMVNPALAGKTFTASTSGRAYQVDGNGNASILDDNPEKRTKDRTEAEAAGFKPFSPGSQTKLVSAKFGKRNERVELVPGDIEVVERGPDIWTAKSGHQYHATEAGEIECFEIDVAEAEAAGFAKA